MKTNKLLQVLSPYGNWQHSKGNQIVDEQAADEMIKKSKRIFAKKIPIYIGHPDEHTNPSKCKEVGFVENIIKTSNAILIVANYNNDVFSKIISKEIKSMSPRWEMQKISDTNYRPIRLVSVGLTNNPNIANSGYIIDFSTSQSAFIKEQNERINASIQHCKKLIDRTNTTARKALKMANQLAKNNLTERLDKYNNQNINTYSHKTFAEVSEQAKKISQQTGESYTKASARLKKQINITKG